MPAMDMIEQPGKVLMDAKGSIALSPNGHGGSLKALYASGAIADMTKRGIEHISYTQVDNPIVRVIDPLFLGLHAMDNCQMSSKMLPKAYPTEKLGNFCLVNGKMTVIEYSDLPDELANERTAEGKLRFLAGSIALHALRVDFVKKLNESGSFGLPFHRAEKKVPYLDAKGNRVAPSQNNAVKLETFVFDALPLTDRTIVYETDRVDEFAPIKNADATGPEPSLDSPTTSKRAQTERAGLWLEKMGVPVARDVKGHVNAVIEISQLTATEPEDLFGMDLPLEVKRGERVLL
jgi:UDP-N-acetylglucosamine/UDP-N-acetylgalactosamine diphosphorylase